MERQLRFTNEACAQLRALEADPSRKGVLKQVLKTLGLLEMNTRHPGLRTHEFESLTGVNGERVWEAHAQNETPCAFRVFLHYGPDEGSGRKRTPVVTVVAITPHP